MALNLSIRSKAERHLWCPRGDVVAFVQTPLDPCWWMCVLKGRIEVAANK